ncbi:MAG: hypothetical protein KDD44_13430 [Bdellovibrionales bacterium]|nr:hypothetical protein [Bdellovibrionales bacterium]
MLKIFLKRTAPWFLICTTLLLVDCAGGSRGTGGIQFSGEVVSRQGAPLAGVSVTVSQTGASDITDNAGLFSIKTQAAPGDVELVVQTASFAASAFVENVQADTSAVQVIIEVDEQERIATIRKDERADQRNDDAKSGTPKPKATKTPFPTPTVNQISSRAPSPTATAAPKDDSSPDDDDQGHDDGASATATPTPTPTPDNHGEDHDHREDNEHHEDNEQAGEDAEAEGTITALTSTLMRVRSISFELTPETRYYDRHERPTTLESFSVGSEVHVHGTWRSGQAIAERVELKD